MKFVLDDDQVVDMWRRNGLTCLQVAKEISCIRRVYALRNARTPTGANPVPDACLEADRAFLNNYQSKGEQL